MWDLASNSNLLTNTTRIVGRGEAIDAILQELRSERLLSVVGAGGIGKTTVALAVAELAIESFEHGVWLVDFAPLKDLSLVPSAIASATGLVVHSADTLSALCKYLRDRETVLVLDNCEHVLEAIAPCVARILAEAPGVHVLATSRAPLGLPEERIHRLPGLAVPPDSAGLSAVEALKFAAIDLFVERASNRVESFALSDADAPIVADICRELDGIALAIELAAMRIDVFGVQGLHQQLDDRFRLLQGRRGGLERHRTLAATLDWSFSLLPAREADLLCAVAVFAGVFRNQDAAAISQLAAAETAASLAELAAQSLLSTDSDAGEASYRPLETTRAYCLEKLGASGQGDAVRSRHAEYVGSVIQRAAGELVTRPAAEWGAEYRRYLDDLRDALAWAGADPTRRELLIQLTAAGTVLWNHFSLTSESHPHLLRATRELRETSLVGTAVEMNLQLALAGSTLYTRGTAPEGRAAVDRALEIALQRQDNGYQLICLRIIAAYELFGGRNDAGLQTLTDFVARAAVVDESALPEGETHLGCAEIFVGQLVPARQRLERLHAGLQGLNDGNSLRFQYNNSSTVLFVLSHALWLTGSPGEAERTAALSVEYARQANHELSQSNALAWAALVSYWTGRVEECRRLSSMLGDLVGKHGIVTWGPVATFCQGALAALSDETRAEGIEVLERTIVECRAIGHRARLPYYIGVLGEALARHGRLPDAEATIDEAIEVATQANDNWSFPELLRIRAFVLAAQGRVAEQESTLLESLALAERQGAGSWRLRTAIDLARLWQTQKRVPEAKQLLRSAFDTFGDGLDTGDVVTAAQLLETLA